MKSEHILFLFVVLALASLACQSQAVDPAPAALAPQKLVQATNEPKTAQVCLTVDTVRLRMGAGTSYGEVATLTGLDVVTITGTPVITEDMAVWMPVTFGAVSGWINARYLC